MTPQIRIVKEKYFGMSNVHIGIGAALKGCNNITEPIFRDPNRLPVVELRIMTNSCPHNCFHCFTEKRPVSLELSDIKYIIDQLADLETHGALIIGEGEPTLDRNFFKILDYFYKKYITPVVFTEAAFKLNDPDFVKRLFDSGASVVPKCDSLFNKDFQNLVVNDKSGTYFDNRNKAIELLMAAGFNAIAEDGTTRMGFDMVVCKKNMYEIEKTLHFCRQNNLFVEFSTYLPIGKSGKNDFDHSLLLNLDDKRSIAELVMKIDEDEYGFLHFAGNNFLTAPCVERMCISGNGNVNPCVGTENVVGNTKMHSLALLNWKIINNFPKHDPRTSDGNCIYRELI